LTSAPAKFILTHATGVSSFTGYIAGTGDVVLENGQIVDGGTDETIKLTENSDTLSIGFDGDDISLTATDGSIELIPETDATAGTIDLLAAGDTDDYIQISTTTNQPLLNFVGCDGSITAAGGDISFGDENLLTTGTLGAGASSLGAVTATSFIISDDTLDVVVDDQLRFASNDEETTIESLGYTGKDAVLQLTADLGADAGDKIQLVSDHSTNSLFFTSDTSVKDTHATILTLSKVGVITTTGDVQVVNDSATTDAVQDVLKLTSSSTGTGAAGLGAGVVFHIDDIGGIEEQASIDVALTTATNGSEDADIIFSQNTAGAITERVRFDADGANILLSGALPAITIGDAGAEDTALNFDGNVQDFHVGLDDTADDLVIGVGSALGTTTALAVDENTDITTSGNLIVEGALDIGTVETFTDSDATPDVSDGSYFITNTTTYTLTDFDGTGIVDGQVIYVESAGAITYDVTSTGLIGGSTDIVTADGDLTSWLYNGTDWLLISFMDLSDDLN